MSLIRYETVARAPLESAQPRLAPLFRPFSLKSLPLKNRIVMVPMTHSIAVDGDPGEIHAAYNGRRTEDEVGLILSKGTANVDCSRRARISPIQNMPSPSSPRTTVIGLTAHARAHGSRPK
jgi:2,4-dienoyl-CoA reductase-like NADH-dependent reductase (Old Yellow Enzyme family)